LRNYNKTHERDWFEGTLASIMDAIRRELRARKVIAAILTAEAIAQEHVEARERHPLLRRHVFARTATTDGSLILVTTPAKRLP
jgi:hypothetical protein